VTRGDVEAFENSSGIAVGTIPKRRGEKREK
jgi:hypothetical protein